jgi:hypothetical protein
MMGATLERESVSSGAWWRRTFEADAVALSSITPSFEMVPRAE